ncbi:hypothetical protein [Aetokthonos hydrillicola]|nr:hypothetical protein [Aetokthonos hydrillicola]MBO3457955.1 hypothetical protein [Aetokthonos hydrillicola CCALA 1050]MBW4587445.1 hypothetical protein [Aetokthonos hydrillicola CCALA 1050]
MVPIHLDALYQKIDRSVVEAMADFSRLPYFDGNKRDVNPIANISEEIVSRPFQNQNLYLKAGIHLHWALPDALTKGIQTKDRDASQEPQSATRTVFPAVPNRWLVTRTKNNQIEKQWVVESDYVYPENEGTQAGSIAYPVTKPQPFCYLGRKLPLQSWLNENQVSSNYLDSITGKPLTAVGYGEPTFAAFYPNCHSVFGFHDDDYTAAIPDGLQYEVIGWYSDAQETYLQAFLETLKNTLSQQGHQTSNIDQKFIEEQFKWTVNLGANQKFPESIGFICYARLKFNIQKNNDNQTNSVNVTVGNTGTEALSAYLAKYIDGDRKPIIEDQLEALLLSSRLENSRLDMTYKLKEARHEKGFNSIGTGTLWTIRSQTVGTTTANAEDGQNQTQLTLPDDIADALDELNLSQQRYDGALYEIESMRRQLFADWYKYMLSAYPREAGVDQYPDIDLVRHFIEVKGIIPLQAKLTEAGNLLLSGDNSGQITSASAGDSSSTSIASILATAINQLLQKITDLNQKKETKEAKVTYTLQQISSPRYWQPKEPVLLMTGEGVKPSPRHGQDGRLREDGLLECQILQNVTTFNRDSFAAISKVIDGIENNQTAEHIAFSIWQEQPWHPFLLEWEVEVFPIREGSNHVTSNNNYDTQYITNSYILKENEPDLSLQPGKGAIVKVANVYSGRSILTPDAGIKLNEQLEVYLKKELLGEYWELKQPDTGKEDYFNKLKNWYSSKPPSPALDEKLKKVAENQSRSPVLDKSQEIKGEIQQIQQWYTNKPVYKIDNSNFTFSNLSAEEQAKDPIYTAIRAYSTLQDFNCLAQSLGGFNEALLMHKQTLQLPIADPLGFADYRPFTEAIRNAVKNSIRSAPEPLNDFNPIRSGAMKILRLRLVDTFGQVQDLNVSEIITTEQMTTPGSSYLVSLPPRFVQPARLNFRWLSANQGEQEMNSHPVTTPICGWILANYLDNSLAIYDNQGKALGSINNVSHQARWESAPGDDLPLAVVDIENIHLRQLVNHIISSNNNGNTDFIQSLITALDSGLENIEPENFAQHQDLALLMGRPIAVVRASLKLELQGLPRINQDWDVFWHDLRRNTRTTDDFDKVQIPVRLGEYQQLNDGLLGYWLEEQDTLSQVFYACQSDADGVEHPGIKLHEPDNAWHIDINAQAPAQTFTMLIDPRGKVHATSGILPTKSIDIPPDKYKDALAKIEISFLSAPILNPLRNLRDTTSLDKRIYLPLPNEESYEWSWVEKEKEEWLVVSSENITQPEPNAVFSGKQVIREGWIKLSRKKADSDSNS